MHTTKGKTGSPTLHTVNTRSSKKQLPVSEPTMSDLLVAISNLQSSQSDILMSNKSLADSFSNQFSDLKKFINNLSNQVAELKTENDFLRNELSALRSKVTSIDTTSVAIAPVNSAQIFQESVEKHKCAFNVIVYGLPESTSTDIPSRVLDDKTKLSDIVLPLSINLPSNFKLIRLGKPSSEKLRPLKIICTSKNEAVSIISDFGTAKKNGLLIPDNFRIVRDKTTLERLLLRSCHAELERRTQSGEADLSISYINGVPKVISRRSKNSQQRRPTIKLKPALNITSH